MLSTLKFAIAVVAALYLAVAPAMAATETPFEPKTFAAAQQSGKPILVDIWASWCPTCAKQTPILATLSADPAFNELIVFKVDFDTQKDVVRDFGARVQSTLIAFHGPQEVGRSAGDTNAASIRTLLERTGH
ncbi:MAG: thioredoxin family protein [Rhodospirillales bacterium]